MSSSYRAPVPLFVPALTAMLVLLVLFVFGVREQDQLARDSVEQLVGQREEIARIVAEGIEADLRSTEASAARLARDLAEHLDDRVPDADAEFARLFESLSDGSTRSRRQPFDPVTDAGVWIPNYVKLDAGLRAFFVQAKRLIEVYGRGANGQVFVDTWVLPSVSGNVIFWPDEPEYIFQATADFDYRETEWVANDAQRELMQRCQRALKRMSEMIAGMLSLAQLGSEGLSPARVDVGVMVRELIQELPAAVRGRVEFDLGPLPMLVADRVLLRQVLHNLIDNAIKYSSGRDPARISIRSLPMAETANECVLEVRDNGVGFDALHADKLFLLFQRLHSGDAFPGTGVGLAVSAKIVELHGGRIWAESSPGEGASFFVALPLDMSGRVGSG